MKINTPMKRYLLLILAIVVMALMLSSGGAIVGHANTRNSLTPNFQNPGGSSPSVTASAESQANSLTLSPGGAVYLYASVTGGGEPISSESYPTDLSVSNSNPYIIGPVIEIGHSSNNTGNFSTAGSYYAMGGARVTSLIYENYTFFNDTSGSNSTTGTFNVQYNGSLAVLVSAASNNYNGSVTSNAPFTYDARTNGSNGNTYTGIIIASATVNRGQYSFTVNYAAGSGDTYASSVGAVIYIFRQVSTPEYNVTFSESGLPGGSTWYVNLSNGNSYHSSTSSIIFQAYNGTYYYTIGSNTVYGPYPSSGSFTVNGGNLVESVTFRLIHYNVTFTETGLPGGTIWSVTLGGISENSDTATIKFVEVNGEYSFSVGKLNGFTPDPSAGVIKVNGQNVTQSISFTAEKYSLSFVEYGLSSGTYWSVSLNGNTLSSYGSTIAFMVYDGTYNYSVSSVSGFTPSPQNGTVTVNGNNVTVSINFKSYKIIFRETGLPPGASWEVSVNGVSETSSNGSIIFKEGNGTYTFTVTTITGYHISPVSGKVSVSGRDTSILVTFSFISPAGMSLYYSPVMEVTSSFVLFVILTLVVILLRRGEKDGF